MALWYSDVPPEDTCEYRSVKPFHCAVGHTRDVALVHVPEAGTALFLPRNVNSLRAMNKAAPAAA
jgi:hypothetical protein